MPQDIPALTRAMVLGDATLLTQQQHFLFSQLGLSHLLCASGLHVAIAFGAVHCLGELIRSIICRIFPETRWAIYHPMAQYPIPLLVTAHYCYLTGLGLAAVRAALALLLWKVLSPYNSQNSGFKRLGLTFAIAPLIGTGSFLSWILSLSACLALLWALRLPEHKSFPGLKSIGVAIAPWLGTMPAVIFSFHQFSLIGPVANLIALPFVSTLVPLGLFHYYLPSKVTIVATHFLTTIFEDTMNLITQWVTCAYWVSAPIWILATGSLYLAHECVRLAQWKLKFRALLMSLCVFLLNQISATENFEAIILDVHQGDAILLQSAASAPTLVDFGPPGFGPYPALVAQRLEERSIHHIGSLVLTHPDLDHVGGLESLLLRHPQVHGQKIVWMRQTHLQEKSSLTAIRMMERVQSQVRLLAENRITNIIPHLQCLALGPIKSTKSLEAVSSNDQSPICRITFTDQSRLLLTGDLSQKGEKWYTLWYPNFLKAHYLKVGHHGSNSSTGLIFLQHVQPKAALISVGARNFYRHPHPDVLKRLAKIGIVPLRTDQLGSISLSGSTSRVRH